MLLKDLRKYDRNWIRRPNVRGKILNLGQIKIPQDPLVLKCKCTCFVPLKHFFFEESCRFQVKTTQK